MTQPPNRFPHQKRVLLVGLLTLVISGVVGTLKNTATTAKTMVTNTPALRANGRIAFTGAGIYVMNDDRKQPGITAA